MEAMMVDPDKVKAFLEVVKTKGLAEDLSKAARHHSAANVAEADEILERMESARNGSPR